MFNLRRCILLAALPMVLAAFAPSAHAGTYILTVHTDGAGPSAMTVTNITGPVGAVVPPATSGKGIKCGNVCYTQYDSGTSVTLTANPGGGY
ncbi:MAG: hypothetical protein WCP34_10800, partial [Pseudomonadota bacterium]